MRTRWREWKDARTTLARNQFNAVRNTFYNAIHEAKSKNWNDFLQGAKGKEIFTTMRYTKPRRTDPTPDIIHGDEHAQTVTEKAKLFLTAPLNDTFCSAPCKWFEDPSNGSPVAAAEHQEEHHPTTPPNQDHHAKESRLQPQDAFPTRCHIEQ